MQLAGGGLMGKSLLLFADGTWNDPSDRTNVFRLFEAFDAGPSNKVDPTHEVGPHQYRTGFNQIALYLEGVGADENIKDPAEAAFGIGVHKKVLDGFLVISELFEQGDLIHLFGFSRGAYIVRSLAGMITSVGLMRPEDTREWGARRMAEQLWKRYKLGQGPLDPQAPSLSSDKPVRLLAVWDTVGALGIPSSSVDTEQDHHNLDFASPQLSSRVEFGRQALAIDETRVDYSPCLWQQRSGIKQLWFAGVHSDIGGGYENKALGDLSLQWMLQEMDQLALGLEFIVPQLGLEPNALGEKHDEVINGQWKGRPIAPRIIPADAQFHQSVFDRFNDQTLNYRPTSLENHSKFHTFYQPS
jgi:uncharacterized protein (DUF2235 family)